MPIHAQGTKLAALDYAASTATNTSEIVTASTDAVNTKGYKYASFYLAHSAADATDSSAKWQSIQLEEATAATGTFSAVSGAVGTTNSTATTSQFVIAAHNNTSESAVTKVNVALNQDREQFFRWKYEPPNDTTMDDIVTWCELSRADQWPNSASEAGVANIVNL